MRLAMLSIRAEASAGDSADETARVMVVLADRLGLQVIVPFNGVEMHAFPNGDPKKLASAYLHALRAEREQADAYSDGTWFANGKSIAHKEIA